jgi:hypothetical protein
MVTVAFWTGLLGIVMPVVLVVLAAWLGDLVTAFIVALLALPLVGFVGRIAITSARLARRPQRMTVDETGITLDSLGQTWRFAWSDITWIGVEMGVKGRWHNQSLVMVLEPLAQQVRKGGATPPVWVPKKEHVWLFDLMTSDHDPVEATNAVERFAGPKWRTEPVAWT